MSEHLWNGLYILAAAGVGVWAFSFILHTASQLSAVLAR